MAFANAEHILEFLTIALYGGKDLGETSKGELMMKQKINYIPFGDESEFNGHAEHFAIGQAMVIYGGSFISNLGKALQSADSENQKKIKETWLNDWNRYRDMAIELYKDIDE